MRHHDCTDQQPPPTMGEAIDTLLENLNVNVVCDVNGSPWASRTYALAEHLLGSILVARPESGQLIKDMIVGDLDQRIEDAKPKYENNMDHFKYAEDVFNKLGIVCYISRNMGWETFTVPNGALGGEIHFSTNWGGSDSAYTRHYRVYANTETSDVYDHWVRQVVDRADVPICFTSDPTSRFLNFVLESLAAINAELEEPTIEGGPTSPTPNEAAEARDASADEPDDVLDRILDDEEAIATGDRTVSMTFHVTPGEVTEWFKSEQQLTIDEPLLNGGIPDPDVVQALDDLRELASDIGERTKSARIRSDVQSIHAHLHQLRNMVL
jgi:hypothetical protein